ncbi:Myc-type, basic helix-loop-helix domain-containing protein [Tanacetum coccineum]
MFSFQQSDELVFHQIPSLISFQQPATNQQDLIVEDKDHVTMEGITNKSVSKTRKRQEDQSPSSSKPNSATPEDSTKDEHTQRKLVHREIERQRRQDMAKLYASLRGLLPLEFVKISINSCPLEEGFPLSRILKAISKEGFKVITCTCTKVNDRLIHSIQAEVNDPVLTDLSMLQQRLTVVANKY